MVQINIYAIVLTMIYLDNNATTMMPDIVKQSMINWCNKGNPSANYTSAKEAKQMMNRFRDNISKLCGFNHQGKGNNVYQIIFTSGASESNCTILHSTITMYSEVTGLRPHIVVSMIEHKSIIDMINSFESRNLIDVTYIYPNISGHIHPDDVEKALRANTCLVCVMHANNETGAINDITTIGRVSHEHNVPFYCDTSQTFGKFPINPIKTNVDAFCISFHKLHGPPGVGALIVKRQLIDGYKFKPFIFGTQNNEFRGGTENLPGIGASHTALQHVMMNRQIKNNTMAALKSYIMKELAARIPARSYSAYYLATHTDTSRALPEIEIVFLSNNNNYYLPNTILLSVVKRSKPAICNREIRNELEKNNIIISVGSACNTSSPKASHVLYAMRADALIRAGALRITLSDETTESDVRAFVRTFITIIKKYN